MRASVAFKRKVLEAALEGGKSVSVMVRRFDVNANQLFNWRKRHRGHRLEGAAPTVPITVVPAAPAAAMSATCGDSLDPDARSVETRWAGSWRFRARATKRDVNEGNVTFNTRGSSGQLKLAYSR